MIKLLTDKIGSALTVSSVLLAIYLIILQDYSFIHLSLAALLLAEGVILNYLCYRFGILGKTTQLPLVLFVTLSVLLLPELGLGTIVYGAVFLIGFYFAFESVEQPKRASSFVMYTGILLAVAQIINHHSILLLAIVLVFFIQAGHRKFRHYLLGLLYFMMVLVFYSSLLFVMELEHKIWELLPSFSLDYTVLSETIFKLVIPFLALSIVTHLLALGTYKFRYPNKSKILNFTFLTQFIAAIIVTLLAAQPDILAYALMPAAMLLSVAFSYSEKAVFANAAFAGLVSICILSLYLHKIIML